MSKTTGISWTMRTWNPWEGCSRVSPGCAQCYMFQLLKQYGRDPGRVRRTNTWRDPARWNEEARRAGRIDKVFTCSLSDFFHEGADAWRAEAWEVLRRCTNLHFQVLTKRPLRIADHLPPDWGNGYPNVWLGVSIESNDYVWRADVLSQIPASVRFISAEPLLGPLPDLDLEHIHWIIVGGESGPGFRDMDHAWARQLRDKAKHQGTAFYFKQSAGRLAGRGDLLDGRRWREFPSTPAPREQAAEHGQVENEPNPAGENAQQEQKSESVQAEGDEEPEHPDAKPDQSEKSADSLAHEGVAEAGVSVTWKKSPIQVAEHMDQCQFDGQTGCCLLTPRVFSHDLQPISTCCLADPLLRAVWWNEIENQLELMVDLGFVPDAPVPWYTDGHNQVCKTLAQKVPYPTEEEWDEYSVKTNARLRQEEEERQRQETERRRVEQEREQESESLRAEPEASKARKTKAAAGDAQTHDSVSVVWKKRRVWKARPNEECFHSGGGERYLLLPTLVRNKRQGSKTVPEPFVRLPPIRTCCMVDPLIRAQWWQEVRSVLEMMHRKEVETVRSGEDVQDWLQQAEAALATEVALPTAEEWKAYQEREVERIRREEENRQRMEAEFQRRQQEHQRRVEERRRAEEAEQRRRAQEREESARAFKEAMDRLDRMTQESEEFWRRIWGSGPASGNSVTEDAEKLRKAEALFGLSWPYTIDEVNKVFRKLAKELHPDRNPGDKEAEKKYLLVQDAFDRLKEKIHKGGA